MDNHTDSGHLCSALQACGTDFLSSWKTALPWGLSKTNLSELKCDLLRRQNCVAETKVFKKILQQTRCDLSRLCVVQFVAATYRPTCTHWVICRCDALQRHVAKCVPTFRTTCCSYVQWTEPKESTFSFHAFSLFGEQLSFVVSKVNELFISCFSL